MKRSPMRRTAFKRKHEPAVAREDRPVAPLGTLRPLTPGTYKGSTSGPVAKVVPVESEPYRRLVAALPCRNCGVVGYSQAAHPNTNKGAGTKTDDRLCFALCAVHPEGGGLVPGCHARFDQGALYSKAVRRELEPVWGADTRRAIEAAGAWPKGLPKLEPA
jgi:hypothetical protein